MFAARHSPNPEVLKVLLGSKANINAKSNDGRTPLMFAAEKNPNQDVLSTLLENNADVKAKSKVGKTALDYARGNEKLKGTEALRLLEEKTGR